MPLEISGSTGQKGYTEPFIGRVDHTLTLKVDVSTLTTAEVDATGKIKPGTPLGENGKLLVGTAGEYVRGVVPEASTLVGANPTNTTLGADTTDPFVAVVVTGVADRDAIEANLGRVLNANEIAGFKAGACKLVLSRI